jgi:uncharacterized protein YqjF (DUF2071 family)
VQGQTWEHLLFAHWRVPLDQLRPHVDRGLPIDTWDGSAWLAVTPFRVRALRPRFLPPLPLVSTFAEVNVRTYSTIDDRPGVFFISLDATSPLAVAAARMAYRLPYFPTRGGLHEVGRAMRFVGDRVAGGDARLDVRYEPSGPAATAAPGSFEQWAIERYCYYRATGDGAIVRGDIHHPPWALQPATASFATNTMPPGDLGLEGDPVLHYAPSQDVVFWPPLPA